MVSSPVGKRLGVFKTVDRDDLMQCFVMNTAHSLRERFAMVRDNAIYVAKVETGAENLEIVIVEKLTKAHAINCDTVSRFSIT